MYMKYTEQVPEAQVRHEKKWMVLIAAALILISFCAVNLGSYLQEIRAEKVRLQTINRNNEIQIQRRQCRNKWPELGSHYNTCIRGIENVR